jgi:DNA primase
MSLFTYIKEHLPILDVITTVVQLKPAGAYWKGSCPFHSEKDASFTVSPDKQIFYCFGCHASGDVIGFIAKLENMTQWEAVQHIIERFQLQIPKHLLTAHQSQNQEKKEEKDRYFNLCKTVSEWAHKQLLANKIALKYVKERNINDTSIKDFSLGYFPSGTNGINSFIKDMASAGFLLKDLLEYGIVQEGRSMVYSPFEERIIFPIKNSLGKHCGFGGRIFKAGDERPKYYNSKESDGFEKGRLLFGFDMAKKSLVDQGFGFLVEGYMDCIMMVQYGYTNTIATLGTACTLDHLKALARSIHTLYVLYDGDQAGQKAMLRLTELCWESNLDLKIITLQSGHDPASFLSQGGNLSPFIEQATDIVTFFINSTGSGFSNKPLSQKMAIAEKITAVISKVSDQFKQDILLHHAATIMQLPFQSLKELMLRTPQQSYEKFHTEKINTPQTNAENNEPEGKEEISLLEEKIFSAIINGLKAPITSSLPVDIKLDIKPYFSPFVQSILQRLDLFIAQNNKNAVSAHQFFDTLAEPEKQWAIKASMQHDGTGCQHMIDYLLARFYKHHWQRIVKDSTEEIVKAKQNNNNQRVQEVLARLSQLKQGILQSRGLKI